MKGCRIWQLTLPVWLAIGGGLLLWSGLLAEARPAAAGSSINWPEISLKLVTNGLNLPVHITHAGDGSGRLFVVERPGLIRIIKNGVLQGTFLNITDRVRDSGSEEGLLSVAFPPGYASKGYFYVYYTNNDGNNVVARYFLTGPDQANLASEQIILTLNHPNNSNHNGGQLAFGPNDGYLYIGTGDGGSSGDPPNNAQNTNSLLGKLLRLDVETGNPSTYTIPKTNPYTQTGGYRGEIWALGLRNPWRFSFDRQTRDLYIGDVGQDSYEEVDYQPAASAGGENYGWRCKEGFHDYNMSGNCPNLTLKPPIHEYPHSVSGPDNCSITGGFIYRGPNYPRMQGVYFFADYCSGRIWGLKYDGMTWQNTFLIQAPFSPTSFGEDEAGHLYITDYDNGAIYQLTDPRGDLSPSTKSVSPALGNPGQTFTYTIVLINNGDPITQTTFVTDTLPAGLAYVPNTLTASSGLVDDSGPALLWQGQLNPTPTITITYQVTVSGLVTGPLPNVAVIKTQGLGVLTRTATVFISPEAVYYFPLIFK